MLAWRFAFRNIFRHKTRSRIALSAIAFGCVSLIFAGGFFEDIFTKIRENEINAHTGHLQLFRSGYFEKGSGEPYTFLISDPMTVMKRIQSVLAVRTICPRLPFEGLILTDERSLTFSAMGIDPTCESVAKANEASRPVNVKQLPLNGSALESGELLSADHPTDVLLGRGLAAALHLRVGDEAALVTRTVDESMSGSDIRVRGIYFTGMKEVDDYSLQINLATAQKILRTNGVQSFVVRLDDTALTASVKKTVTDIVQTEKLDLEVRSWDQVSDYPLKMRQLFVQWFLVLKIILSFIVLLGIYNIMSMSVMERTAEIGTLRALGMKQRGIVRLFLLEAIGLGFLGGVGGGIVGSLVTGLIARIGIPMTPLPGFTAPWRMEPIIMPSVIFSSLILSILASVFSTVLPAIRASKQDIAAALRHTN